MNILQLLASVPWKPGLGDLTFMGWFTVGAYFGVTLFCAVLALRAERTYQPPDLRHQQIFWSALAMIVLFLGANKQLNLLSWFTALGRTLAWSQGWYQLRQPVQAGFLIGAVIAGGIVFGLAGWALHSSLRQHWIPFCGVLFLSGFVLARAVSLHTLDLLIRDQVAGVRLNWLLELGGIALIAIPAARTFQRSVRKVNKRAQALAASERPLK